MRDLDKGHRVKFWISEEVESIIREVCAKNPDQPLDFDDILHFAAYNQAKQLGRDYFKAFKQQLWNISQMTLLKAVMSNSLPEEEAKKADLLLKKAWVKPANQMPKDLYGQISNEVDASIAVEEEKTRALDFIKECFNELPSLTKKCGFTLEKCLEEADSIEDRFAKIMPPKLNIKGLDDNQTAEQETEAETEQEAETELETNLHLEGGEIHLVSQKIEKLIPIAELSEDKKIEGNYMPLELYFRSNSNLAPYANAFAGIHMTINVLQYTVNNPSATNIKMFGPYRTPLHNFFIEKDGSIILISRCDAEEDFRKRGKSENVTLCEPKSFGFDEKTTAKVLERIVKIKFLNGECNYNKAEQKILKDWLVKEGPSKMRELYFSHILSGFPLKLGDYNLNSDLKKIFDKLKA